MASKSGKSCKSCDALSAQNKELATLNKELRDTNARLKANLEARDATLEERDAKIKRLELKYAQLLAALQHSQGLNACLIESVSDADAPPPRSRASSVTSETLSSTASLGLQRLTLSRTTPPILPQQKKPSNTKASATPSQQQTPKPAKRAASRSPPKKSAPKKTVTRYHQCVLCGWHDRASNKNVPRHFHTNHDNYHYNIKEHGKTFFYLVVDAPLDNWPESTPKPWDVMELLGVKGIDARWLKTKEASRPTTPTSPKTSTPKQKSVKSREYISSSSEDSDNEEETLSGRGKEPDLSASSDSDA